MGLFGSKKTKADYDAEIAKLKAKIAKAKSESTNDIMFLQYRDIMNADIAKLKAKKAALK